MGKCDGYARGLWRPEDGRPFLHHVIWEQTHGRPVPRGHVVRFRDGNLNNFEPGNLELQTRNEVCRQNHGAALARKSRERTELLLRRANRKEKAHGLFETLTASR